MRRRAICSNPPARGASPPSVRRLAQKNAIVPKSAPPASTSSAGPIDTVVPTRTAHTIVPTGAKVATRLASWSSEASAEPSRSRDAWGAVASTEEGRRAARERVFLSRRATSVIEVPELGVELLVVRVARRGGLGRRPRESCGPSAPALEGEPQRDGTPQDGDDGDRVDGPHRPRVG